MTHAHATATPPERRIAPNSLAALVVALIAVSVSLSFVFAVLPPIARDLGLSELQLSLIVSPAALVFVLASSFWDGASERFGRKPVILIAIGAVALATLVFGWVIGAPQSGTITVMATFLLLASYPVALAALAGGLIPAAQASVADRTSTDKRPSAIAVIGALFMLCGMGALTVVTAFAAQLVTRGAFGIGMGLVLPTALGLPTVDAEAAGDQGRAGGWSGAAQGLKLVFGPLAGAVVYRLGQVAPYVAGFALLLVATVLAGLVAPRAIRPRDEQLQEQMG